MPTHDAALFSDPLARPAAEASPGGPEEHLPTQPEQPAQPDQPHPAQRPGHCGDAGWLTPASDWPDARPGGAPADLLTGPSTHSDTLPGFEAALADDDDDDEDDDFDDDDSDLFDDDEDDDDLFDDDDDEDSDDLDDEDEDYAEDDDEDDDDDLDEYFSQNDD